MADFVGYFRPRFLRIFRSNSAEKDHVGNLITGRVRGASSTRPTITNVSPPPGSIIAPGATCTRDVTDVDSTVTTAMFARFENAWEVIFDGAAFSPTYSSSTRTSIPNGFRFEIRRNGGWPGAFSIGSVDVDGTGQQPE